MPLTSASTDTEVEAAYDNNADYDVPPDVSKCEAFIQACRILLRRRANEYGIAGRSVKRETIENQISDAMKFYKSRARGRSRSVGVRFGVREGLD